MKSILISNPVWGEFNCNVFCNYSLKSLLSPGNIPKLLKKDYKIILHILTRSNDKHIFLNNKNFNKIPKNVAIEFHYIKKIYKNKYKNVTALQNISIKRSLKEKFIVFNYADFFWSDCSLNNTIKTIEKEKINFLSYFCLPVDFKSAKKFITSKINETN